MSQEYVDSEISIREPIEKKKKLNVANESELFQGSCRQKCEPDGIWTIYIETSITGQLIDSKQKHEEGKQHRISIKLFMINH